MITRLLQHPLTRDMNVDDPATTVLRRRIIKEKSFLRRIYQEWYDRIIDALPLPHEPVLEIGSGAGFLNERLSSVIKSEIFLCPDISLVLDARKLPFADGTVRAIVMTDVLHHIPSAESFFSEASRVMSPGGRILMIEPWVTEWSTFIYRHYHPEPFRPDAEDWGFPERGPLSGANGAMPWIIFNRDIGRFRNLFPDLNIVSIQPFMPLRYLLSGGVSMRSLMPAWTFPFWRFLENCLAPWRDSLAMFAFIVIERR